MATTFSHGRCTGKDASARRTMQSQHALSQRTEDAQLYYHAGMIERSLGNAALARTYLDRALMINPHFSATQARSRAPRSIRSEARHV